MEEKAFGSTENHKATGKEWHGRGYPQYDPDIHIPMLKEIFGNGGGLTAFLGAAEISSVSFYNWLKKYPDFKHQYEVAINRGSALWELMPLEAARSGVNINHGYWSMILRMRYKQSVVNLNKVAGDTTSARMKAAWESLENGGITPQEFNQIASGLSTESRIAEVDLKKQELETAQDNKEANASMTDEALKAYMAVMQGKKLVEVPSE